MLKRRQLGQPPDAVAHHFKAQYRLQKVLSGWRSGKDKPRFAVTVARKLAGVRVSVMQESAVEIKAGAACRLHALDQNRVDDPVANSEGNGLRGFEHVFARRFRDKLS